MNYPIYNDIEKSTYKYQFLNLTFYFSSNVYLSKFRARLDAFIHNEEVKMCLKYHAKLNADELLSILLYRNIEKRGFRVYNFDERLDDKLIFNVNLE